MGITREELIQAIMEAVDLSKVRAAAKASKLIRSPAGQKVSRATWDAANQAAVRPKLRSWVKSAVRR